MLNDLINAVFVSRYRIQNSSKNIISSLQNFSTVLLKGRNQELLAEKIP